MLGFRRKQRCRFKYLWLSPVRAEALCLLLSHPQHVDGKQVEGAGVSQEGPSQHCCWNECLPLKTNYFHLVKEEKLLWVYCSSSLAFPRRRVAPFFWLGHCSEMGSWVCLAFTYVHLLLQCLFYMKFHFVEWFHHLTGRYSALTLISAIFKTSASLGVSCNVKCFPKGDVAIAVQHQSPDKRQESDAALNLASVQSTPALQTDLQSCYLPRNNIKAPQCVCTGNEFTEN